MQQIIKEKILTERRDKLIDWAELKRIKRTDKERKDIALKDMKRKKQQRDNESSLSQESDEEGQYSDVYSSEEDQKEIISFGKQTKFGFEDMKKIQVK